MLYMLVRRRRCYDDVSTSTAGRSWRLDNSPNAESVTTDAEGFGHSLRSSGFVRRRRRRNRRRRHTARRTRAPELIFNPSDISARSSQTYTTDKQSTLVRTRRRRRARFI